MMSCSLAPCPVGMDKMSINVMCSSPYISLFPSGPELWPNLKPQAQNNQALLDGWPTVHQATHSSQLTLPVLSILAYPSLEKKNPPVYSLRCLHILLLVCFPFCSSSLPSLTEPSPLPKSEFAFISHLCEVLDFVIRCGLITMCLWDRSYSIMSWWFDCLPHLPVHTS